ACKNEQGKLDGILAKGSAGTGMDDLRTFAATATCERLGARIAAALDRFKADEAKRAREAAQKAADAALTAQKKQEEDARRAQADEAERQAKAAEAQRQADQAARNKAAADAAAARAAAEKQAKDDER